MYQTLLLFSRITTKATRYLKNAATLTASAVGQVPDVGMPHYRDARMQHTQRTQPALPGVTTVVAPRECQHPLTECSLHLQRKFQENKSFCNKTRSVHGQKMLVKPSLQLSIQTLMLNLFISWTQLHS